ncbi:MULTISPECIES: sigma-70 family RNA polymerase sigma factor [Maribellus]|uniref:Sigma-70 family RNA polymerase sigma factor n=1 Tax=Maribellus comscasis TaxID=2681766 RepID=A0A6I6K7W0_9BACT|nr:MULTISPECIES: RNA polymerase sigma factor RpoD/SigA [Maribellus]MCG6190945.1 RNA polymerase sigma factor RpoD/SigA [Maribellus maritimus]QGY46124.1 sigma-70 family RNA polymerase sigma factor [Maribellus comscasis]
MRQLKITKQVTNRDNLSINIYLQEIGKIDMLTANEEAELAGRISEGDRDAFEKMVKANLRFVISVSKQYQNQGLSLSDLINEGNLGLLKAAERFDRNRGFKFITYAVWWIRQSISQAIAENSRTVRLPLNKIGLKNKISKAYNQLSHEFLREPTIDELSGILNLQSEIVEDVLNIFNVQISLDAPIGTEDQINLYDLILNENSPSPDIHLNENSFRKEIERSLTVLSSRDSAIVRSYYGFDSPEPLSLSEIAFNYGLSSERVRQIKDSAIKKLRAKNILKEYICV